MCNDNDRHNMSLYHRSYQTGSYSGDGDYGTKVM